jgi:Protein of unknown function (DUF4241)
VKLPCPALWQVFADGAQVVRDDDGTVETAHTLDIGHLTLPTGRIVLSDPFLDPWNEPLSVRVTPGSYPVLLSVIRGDAALVMIAFGNGPPASWRQTEPPTFGVDSGTGVLMDHKVCRFLRRKAEANRYERYSRAFHDALEEADGLSANCCIDRRSGANVILFRTWGGDGHFPSYYGFGADGSVTCLVTDMYLAFDGVVAVKTDAGNSGSV